MKRYMVHLLLIVILFTVPAHYSVRAENTSARDGVVLQWQSTIVQDAYRIEVALPAGYDRDFNQRYNVVYILDGNWNAENAREIAERLSNRNAIVPLILVSVCPIQALEKGYTGKSYSRCRDLTPTFVKKYPGSGKARQFAEFLKTELIPYIDDRFRTIPEPENRCLVGHSFGGLFTYTMLFNDSDTFKKFMAFSPSIWWDKRVLLKYEADYAEHHSNLEAQLYTTVGGRELLMKGNFHRMLRQLEGRHYVGLDLLSEVIKGAKHVTSWNPSFERGLLHFFSK